MNWKKYDKNFKLAGDIARIKNAAYGDDSLISFGEMGILARISDKITRVHNIVKHKLDDNDESIKDNMLDIINYCNYYLILFADKK